MKPNLVKAQGTTILDLVNQIFLKGEFVCPIDYEVKEGEIVIGELSDYEKAIILASTQVVKRYNTAVTNAIKEGIEECDDVQMYLDKAANKAFDKLLFVSIYYRLGKVAVESDKLGLRKDWKIVTMSKTEDKEIDDKDCLSCPMAGICPGSL